jgi:DNA polymerase III alpha subunit (gram-positive type)
MPRMARKSNPKSTDAWTEWERGEARKQEIAAGKQATLEDGFRTPQPHETNSAALYASPSNHSTHMSIADLSVGDKRVAVSGAVTYLEQRTGKTSGRKYVRIGLKDSTDTIFFNVFEALPTGLKVGSKLSLSNVMEVTEFNGQKTLSLGRYVKAKVE